MFGKIMSSNRVIQSVALAALAFGLTACQFQPLYTSDSGTVGTQGAALSSVSVKQVETRVAQQVRNHLVFLLSGGSSPIDPSHEVRLRVTSTDAVLASAIAGTTTGVSKGNTAGSVQVTVSYEIYDFTRKEVTHRGTRRANAAYDKTNQVFASERASRDAENRAAREVAEQLRLAIGSDFSRL